MIGVKFFSAAMNDAIESKWISKWNYEFLDT